MSFHMPLKYNKSLDPGRKQISGCCWEELKTANETFAEDGNCHYLDCGDGFMGEYFGISKPNKLYI